MLDRFRGHLTVLVTRNSPISETWPHLLHLTFCCFSMLYHLSQWIPSWDLWNISVVYYRYTYRALCKTILKSCKLLLPKVRNARVSIFMAFHLHLIRWMPSDFSCNRPLISIICIGPIKTVPIFEIHSIKGSERVDWNAYEQQVAFAEVSRFHIYSLFELLQVFIVTCILYSQEQNWANLFSYFFYSDELLPGFSALPHSGFFDFHGTSPSSPVGESPIWTIIETWCQFE